MLSACIALAKGPKKFLAVAFVLILKSVILIDLKFLEKSFYFHFTLNYVFLCVMCVAENLLDVISEFCTLIVLIII